MKKVLIVGSNRGIGLELARRSKARGDQVTAVCRTRSAGLDALGVTVLDGIDVTLHAGREALVERVRGLRWDAIWLVAGILDSDTLDTLDETSVRAQIETNAIAPLLLAASLAAQIDRGGTLALLTSRMGSIADNGSGGYYGYRMSKAALNAAAKSLALDLAPRGVHVALLHPGYVRTGMTGGQGLIDADESARLLLGLVDRTDGERSGRFFHADGSELPW
jgi:NAD(P)-dependent dehydrogenase (short-subunit alcohol dehydrogenase family)